MRPLSCVMSSVVKGVSVGEKLPKLYCLFYPMRNYQIKKSSNTPFNNTL